MEIDARQVFRENRGNIIVQAVCRAVSLVCRIRIVYSICALLEAALYHTWTSRMSVSRLIMIVAAGIICYLAERLQARLADSLQTDGQSRRVILYWVQLIYSILAPLGLFALLVILDAKVAIFLLIGVPVIGLLSLLLQKVLTGAKNLRQMSLESIGIELSFLDVFTYLCTALAIILVVQDVMAGREYFHEAMMVLLLAAEFYRPLRRLSLRFRDMVLHEDEEESETPIALIQGVTNSAADEDLYLEYESIKKNPLVGYLFGREKHNLGFLFLMILLGVFSYLAAITIPIVGAYVLVMAMQGQDVKFALINLIIMALARGLFRSLEDFTKDKLSKRIAKDYTGKVPEADVPLYVRFYTRTVPSVIVASIFSLLMLGFVWVASTPLVTVVLLLCYILVGVIIPMQKGTFHKGFRSPLVHLTVVNATVAELFLMLFYLQAGEVSFLGATFVVVTTFLSFDPLITLSTYPNQLREIFVSASHLKEQESSEDYDG